MSIMKCDVPDRPSDTDGAMYMLKKGADLWNPKRVPTMLLPSSSARSHRQGNINTWVKSLRRRRHYRSCLSAVLFSSILFFLWLLYPLISPLSDGHDASESHRELEVSQPNANSESEDLPPLYEQWYEFEQSLPQQDESLPYPEGADADFFYASNHIWGLGFNNALQEQLFLSHLAYLSNRTFVFDVYTWNYVPEEPYSNYYGSLIPSRIPLTAYLSGPTVGGSYGKDTNVPRAVSKPYFQKMCPEPALIRSNEVNDELGNSADASIMMKAWVTKLKGYPSKCVEVGDSDQIFNFWVFGNGERVLPFFDEFIKSPVLTRFTWSSLVHDALSANIHLFTDKPNPVNRPPSPIRLLQPDDDIEDGELIPGLLAIHIRRGDYAEHCRNLAKWGAEFMGWLRHPLLIDQFDKPPMAGKEDTEEIADAYRQRCFPSIDEIAAKIDAVRWTPEGHGLRRIYIMTNGQAEWVNELKNRILATGGWDGVASSRDLSLIPEQKYIGQAIDMAIGMRSQIFIGNGFSSLSANVVVLRLSRNYSALANRLW